MTTYNLVDQFKARVLFPIYRNWGAGRVFRGNYKGAIADCTKAINICPDDAIPYLHRGAAYYQLTDTHNALRDLNRALTLDPTLTNAYINRGNIYYALQRYPDAIADYNLATHYAPANPITYYNRGLVYAAQGDYLSAVADYTEAIQRAPDYGFIYGNRGEAYFMLADYQRALADFQTAHHKLPRLRRAVAGMAVACHALGETAKAVMLWDTLLQRNSHYQDANWVQAEHAWSPTLTDEGRGLLSKL